MPHGNSRPCKLGALLGNTHTLTDLDRALLRGWLDTGNDGRGRKVSCNVMSVALRNDGHDIGSTTLKDHRGRRCACFRERADG